MVTAAGAQTTTTYTYNAADQLLTEVKGSLTTDYEYDLDGNRTKKIAPDKTAVYTWDALGRLASVDTDNDGTLDFVAGYDYRTRRVTKSEKNSSGTLEPTRFRYDGGSAFDELDQDGNKKSDFSRVPGLGGGVASILNANRVVKDNKPAREEYYVYNSVGHSVLLVDGSCTPVTGFLEHCSSLRYSMKTIDTYRKRLKQFLLFAHDHGTKNIRNVSLALVRNFQDQLISREMKPCSIEHYMVTLRTYLKWCYNHRLLLSDLSSRMEIPNKGSSLPPQPLTEDDMQRLFQIMPTVGFKSLRTRAIIELFYAAGLRKQELIDLNLGNLDFTKGLVHIRGKGDKERLVPVHEQALNAISAYLVERGGKPNQKSPLFVSFSRKDQTAQRITDSAVNRIFAELNKRFHKHLHPYLLRHTLALHLLQRDVDVRYVQMLLGHESPDMTSRYLGYCKDEIKRQYDMGIDWILSQE